MAFIEADDIQKVYNKGEESELCVLKNINLKIKKKEFVSIIGPSGSGKTTLLYILGCLLKPTYGRLLIDGMETSKLTDKNLSKIRGEKIGFVFQQYNLIPSLTALENVGLSLRINGKSKKHSESRAKELLEIVGLENRLNHKPPELSGGEQQRVAIARALSNQPQIILADEPTGNLDTKTGERILKVLKTLNKEGYTVIVITHDLGVAKHGKRVIKMKDGMIVN